jgi:hypothetical protein
MRCVRLVARAVGGGVMWHGPVVSVGAAPMAAMYVTTVMLAAVY